MQIFVPAESDSTERRVAPVPATVAKLVKLGAQVAVESGLGARVHFADSEYAAAGAAVTADRASALKSADMVLRLHKPPPAEVALLRPGCIHVSYLDPFNDTALLCSLAAAGTSAVCMEMIPRSTIAQKMDALSSQASLAGYAAVLLAADRFHGILPMMTTPSGTIRPAQVFVIGAGVAGLQAIATAKRLGAAVEAFDTRPVVEEQVRSLGAKFVKVDLGETAQTAQGYAQELTPAQLAKQREVMAQRAAAADIVITTAQVFGRKAPRIVTTETVTKMKPGSVVVDMAADTGGNVECSRVDEEVDVNGVKVLGHRNLANRVPRVASQMYASNLAAFVEHFWDAATKTFRLDPADDLLRHCLVTHGGAILPENLRALAASA